MADWIGKAPITLNSWRAIQVSYLANRPLNSTSSKPQVSEMIENQYQQSISSQMWQVDAQLNSNAKHLTQYALSLFISNYTTKLAYSYQKILISTTTEANYILERRNNFFL